jgi:hypothetical protein
MGRRSRRRAQAPGRGGGGGLRSDAGSRPEAVGISLLPDQWPHPSARGASQATLAAKIAACESPPPRCGGQDIGVRGDRHVTVAGGSAGRHWRHARPIGGGQHETPAATGRPAPARARCANARGGPSPARPAALAARRRRGSAACRLPGVQALEDGERLVARRAPSIAAWAADAPRRRRRARTPRRPCQQLFRLALPLRGSAARAVRCHPPR